MLHFVHRFLIVFVYDYILSDKLSFSIVLMHVFCLEYLILFLGGLYKLGQVSRIISASLYGVSEVITLVLLYIFVVEIEVLIPLGLLRSFLQSHNSHSNHYEE